MSIDPNDPDCTLTRADQVKPGDYLSLDNDPYMDPDGDQAWLEFEYAVVATIDPTDVPPGYEAPAGGVLIEFESGELTAFPVDHMVPVYAQFDNPVLNW